MKKKKLIQIPLPKKKLTARQKQVLCLIANGKSNKEVAKALGIGIRTAETHREIIMANLNIHNLAGLTKYALAKGLVSNEFILLSPLP